MGAVRLHFKKGRDDWEYGYITIMIWLDTGVMVAYDNGNYKLVEYGEPEDLANLHWQLQQGEATLNYSQTLNFIRATDILSKVLINAEGDFTNFVFSLICQLTPRFKTLKSFESYYLDYSSGLLAVVRREFEKEPGLRGKLENFLNS